MFARFCNDENRVTPLFGDQHQLLYTKYQQPENSQKDKRDRYHYEEALYLHLKFLDPELAHPFDYLFVKFFVRPLVDVVLVIPVREVIWVPPDSSEFAILREIALFLFFSRQRLS